MEDTVISLSLLWLQTHFPNLLTEVSAWLAQWPTARKATNYLYRTFIEGLYTIESFSQLESCLRSKVLSKNHDMHSIYKSMEDLWPLKLIDTEFRGMHFNHVAILLENEFLALPLFFSQHAGSCSTLKWEGSEPETGSSEWKNLRTRQTSH